jgi:hypothetical protein
VPGDAFVVLAPRAEICQKVISEALSRQCEWREQNRNAAIAANCSRAATISPHADWRDNADTQRERLDSIRRRPAAAAAAAAAD